jgi:hypothetical protein
MAVLVYRIILTAIIITMLVGVAVQATKPKEEMEASVGEVEGTLLTHLSLGAMVAAKTVELLEMLVKLGVLMAVALMVLKKTLERLGRIQEVAVEDIKLAVVMLSVVLLQVRVVLE